MPIAVNLERSNKCSIQTLGWKRNGKKSKLPLKKTGRGALTTPARRFIGLKPIHPAQFARKGNIRKKNGGDSKKVFAGESRTREKSANGHLSSEERKMPADDRVQSTPTCVAEMGCVYLDRRLREIEEV